MKTLYIAVAVAALGAAGCGDDLTELLVVVDSNLRVPGEIDTVQIQVSGVAGGTQSSSGRLVAGSGSGSLPRTLAVVHEGGPLGPIEVRAQALLGTTLVLERRARVSFVQGEVRVLRLELDADCLGVTCAGDTTCAHGACAAIAVPESELPRWTGEVPHRDGGVGGDGCTPTTERCNRMDDDCDGVVDNGIDLMTDPANCGSCGMRCAPIAGSMSTCVAGACALVCMPGFGDCDGDPSNGCENDLMAPTACGSCTNDCTIPNTVSICDASACMVTGCDVGFGDCDADATHGCEQSLDTLTHCGACGVSCAPVNAAGTCATRMCAIESCNMGFGDCDMDPTTGCETPLTTLVDCGVCGTACALAGGTETCATGTCAIDTCDVGVGDCDMDPTTGCERPLTTLTDCGACGTACAPPNATGSCGTGTCAVATCDTGFGDCDTSAINGCEVNLVIDDLHCGTCAIVCGAAESCFGSACRGDTQVVQVAAGGAHSCGLQVGGTVRCWGSNANGQLGDGSLTESTVPVAVSSLADATMIAAGAQHTCALRATGAVVCWGQNSNGQLGDSSMTRRTAPVAVTGLTDAVWIAAGLAHTCAVRATGAVVCWGDNGDSQIGDGAGGARRTSPAMVVGITDATRVTAGSGHTCALRGAGAVSCWGRNTAGQLGDASTTRRGTPVAAMGLADATDLSAGAIHTCAVRATGTVMCWGDNAEGQLGTGGGSRDVPTAVGSIADAVEIDAGGAHSCVRRTPGTLSCWGRNAEGQLGDMSTTPRPMPVAVSGIADAASLSAGTNHTCAAHVDGSVACWGANANGQLGDTSRTNRNAPVAVSGLP